MKHMGVDFDILFPWLLDVKSGFIIYEFALSIAFNILPITKKKGMRT